MTYVCKLYISCTGEEFYFLDPKSAQAYAGALIAKEKIKATDKWDITIYGANPDPKDIK